MHRIALPSSRTITKFLICTTIIILLAGVGFSTVLAGQRIAVGKDTKPADLLYSPQRITFTCNALDTLQLSPGLIDTLQNDTTGGPTEVLGYNCAPWSEEGPEHIYQLDVAAEMEFWAGLREIGDEDLDLFLLSDCDTDACLVGANTEFSIELQPGTYYLIVDGAGTNNPAEGPYDLVYETRYLGLPAAACDASDATPIDIAWGEFTDSVDSTLFGTPNYVQSYECSGITERGGELWMAVTLEQYHHFTVVATDLFPSLDAALWLFDGCDPNANCLAFADESTAGQDESLTWTNHTNEQVTVYLALDSYRQVEENEDDAGQFILNFTGLQNVPTVKENWGNMRARYRSLDR